MAHQDLKQTLKNVATKLDGGGGEKALVDGPLKNFFCGLPY